MKALLRSSGLIAVLVLTPAFAFDATLDIEGSKLHVFIDDADYEVKSDHILRWINESANIVSKYYGRFPVDEAYIAVSGREGKGVLSGIALGEAGGVVNVTIGLSSDKADLSDDWVLVHELIHLAFPKVQTRHHWIEEGISVYVEAISRVQAGDIDEKLVWDSFRRGMPNGLPKNGEGGLDNTPTWGRIYWGGAMFFLLADIKIAQSTGGSKSLKDGLRAIVDSGFNISKSSTPSKMFQIADSATGVQVLTQLYESMRLRAVDVDLETLWKELGVVENSDGVSLVDDTSMADVRKWITRP